MIRKRRFLEKSPEKLAEYPKKAKKKALERKQGLLSFTRKVTNSHNCFSEVKKSQPILPTWAWVVTWIAGVMAWMTGPAAAASVDAGFGLSGGGISADSALAMFLIGLAVGVPAGIGLFFAYLALREKKATQEEQQLEALLGSISEHEESTGNPWNGINDEREAEESFEREAAEERRDPWERPTDWWRHVEDDA